jgi:hypothetical protein
VQAHAYAHTDRDADIHADSNADFAARGGLHRAAERHDGVVAARRDFGRGRGRPDWVVTGYVRG